MTVAPESYVFVVKEKKRIPKDDERQAREPDDAEIMKDRFDEWLNDWWDEHHPESE